MNGRPAIFTQQLADAVCERLAAGQTLREVCAAEEMPSSATVRRWVLADPEGFGKQYAIAKELGWQEMADEILEISDDGSNDWLERETETGRKTVEFNHEHVQRSRLRADNRKWLLARVLPHIYGDRLSTTSVQLGPDGKPIDPTRQTFVLQTKTLEVER